MTTATTIHMTTTARDPAPLGFVMYEGPSMIDGSPIVALLSLRSTNSKTGDMAQLWILRADMSPSQAAVEGADFAVCGDCPHRHHSGGACYVIPSKAPRAVWQAWKAGRYVVPAGREVRAALAGRMVRLGSYGDPAALPAAALQACVAGARGWTGSTHQWRLVTGAQGAALRRLCMASCDSAEEAKEAAVRGWRVFRVRRESEPLLPGITEIACPASPEGGLRRNCVICGACNGSRSVGSTLDFRANIVIIVHGPRASRF